MSPKASSHVLLTVAALWVIPVAANAQADPVMLDLTAADNAAQIVAGGDVLGIAAVAGRSGVHSGLTALPTVAAAAGNALGSSFYPLDVSNPANAPTVGRAQHHPIYVNAPPSHWGDPATFLTDLGKSSFIHLVDQYVGSTDDKRYTLGTSFQFVNLASAMPGSTVRVPLLAALLHSAASRGGSGLGNVYHIFLPQGVDVCLPGECYSPDAPSTFTFCALHTGVIFSDAVGLVVFTLEPYQNTPGCSVAPGSPNGAVVDSTNNSLSHEVFETITDPILNAWYVHELRFGFGNEIADVCEAAAIVNRQIYFSSPNTVLNGRVYNVQAEYSNRIHGCTYGPGAGAAQ